MNDFFASIYETLFGIFDQTYELIFSVMYYESGYMKLFLAFTLIPLICWALFYFLWKYPYGRWWHWIVWLLIVSVIVFGVTWGITNSVIFNSSNPDLIEALADPSTGYEMYAQGLPINYATINTILSVIVGIVCSIIMKQFSKVQAHLPF